VIASVNPTTGETVATFDALSSAEVDRRLDTAAAASAEWRRSSVEDRSTLLRSVAARLEADKAHFAGLMTLEMGKTLASAVAEAEKCALACRYYADHLAEFTAPQVVVETAAERGAVRFDPLGVVLAVMPWNFPFWQVMRFAAPALAAGNAGLLKHASNVPQCALALEELFVSAGAPAGLFQTLLVGSGAVDGLIADDRVQAVTLTGSEHAGRAVAAAAGRHLKRSVLELGGSDPFVVCSSADVARAAEVAVAARCINNGQSCIAAKRFIVDAPVAEAFVARLVEGMRGLRVGDPRDAATTLGPLATRAIRDELDAQVRATVAAGARVALGGAPRSGPGFFHEATVLLDVPAGSPGADDELFGPVASVFVVRGLDEALARANATRFGLGASVWTSDPRDVARCEAELDAGSVFFNAMVASDPRFPFGGVKASGYGRELGLWGFREFVNVKTVRRFGGLPSLH
jgi:succinate-semialdehyde dehydrogenase/glutarate-semialdehyde dehydrogenase